MKWIGASIPEYQPLRVLWRSFCDNAWRTICPAPFRSLIRELVPSLFVESITRSTSKSAQPVFRYGLTKSFLSQKYFWRGSRFFSSFFLSFSSHTFSWACGELAWIPQVFFKLSFCTFTCLSNNSLISSWISAKFVSALLPCMLYLSYYFQSEVNAWMYLRKAITLQVDSFHNLDPLEMICINFQIHNLYWCITL